jgi:hypothetical protein
VLRALAAGHPPPLLGSPPTRLGGGQRVDGSDGGGVRAADSGREVADGSAGGNERAARCGRIAGFVDGALADDHPPVAGVVGASTLAEALAAGRTELVVSFAGALAAGRTELVASFAGALAAGRTELVASFAGALAAGRTELVVSFAGAPARAAATVSAEPVAAQPGAAAGATAGAVATGGDGGTTTGAGAGAGAAGRTRADTIGSIRFEAVLSGGASTAGWPGGASKAGGDGGAASTASSTDSVMGDSPGSITGAGRAARLRPPTLAFDPRRGVNINPRSTSSTADRIRGSLARIVGGVSSVSSSLSIGAMAPGAFAAAGSENRICISLSSDILPRLHAPHRQPAAFTKSIIARSSSAVEKTTCPLNNIAMAMLYHALHGRAGRRYLVRS